MILRRRFTPRHAVETPATLFPLDRTGAGQNGLQVSILDLSLGGARLTSKVAVPLGTIWRLNFKSRDGREIDGSLLIRSCHPRGSGEFQIGGQHVIDLSTLTAAEVEAANVSSDVHALAQEGIRAPWELRHNMVAAEAITVASISAISVCAQKDLMVSEAIVDCTLDVSGRLIAPSASLAGGVSHVRRGAFIGELGSSDGSPTTLVLGMSLGTSMVLGAANTELASRSAAIEQRQTALAELNARPPSSLTHADRETLTVLMSELPDLIKKHAALEAKVAKIKERVAGVGETRLEVTRAIHPGVTVVASTSRMTFTKPITGPVVFGLTPGGDFAITSSADASLGPISACATVTRLAA